MMTLMMAAMLVVVQGLGKMVPTIANATKRGATVMCAVTWWRHRLWHHTTSSGGLPFTWGTFIYLLAWGTRQSGLCIWFTTHFASFFMLGAPWMPAQDGLVLRRPARTGIRTILDSTNISKLGAPSIWRLEMSGIWPIPFLTTLQHLKIGWGMLVTRVALGAGVVNVRGLKTLRTSGLWGWALSILHMASTQETRFKQDQESTLDNLQLIKFYTFTP